MSSVHPWGSLLAWLVGVALAPGVSFAGDDAEWREFAEVRDFTPVLDLSFAGGRLPSAFGFPPFYSKIIRCNAVNGEIQYYTDEDGRLDTTNEPFSRNPWEPMADRLRIYAHRQTDEDHAKVGSIQRYAATGVLAGMFTTEKAFWFEQGAVEIEAALPIQPGSFAAIWLLQEEGEAPPEIDLAEIPGPNSAGYRLNYHENNAEYNQQTQHKTTVTDGWPGVGHDVARKFGLIIDRNEDDTRYRYRYYIDRQLVKTVIPDDYHPLLPKVSSAPFYRNLLVNFAVNSHWLANKVNDSTDWDQMYLDIHYVKMWHKPVALPGTAIFDIDAGGDPAGVISRLKVKRAGVASVFVDGRETLVGEDTPRVGVDLRTGRVLGVMLERGTTNLLPGGRLELQQENVASAPAFVVPGGQRATASGAGAQAVVEFTAPSAGSYALSCRVAASDPLRRVQWDAGTGAGSRSSVQRGFPREVQRWFSFEDHAHEAGGRIRFGLAAGNPASHGAPADWVETGMNAQVERTDLGGTRTTSWTSSTRGDEALVIPVPDAAVAIWQVWGRGEWSQKMDLGRHAHDDGKITITVADIPARDLRPVGLDCGNRHLRAVSVEPVQ